jgi:hypothetical protein
MSDDRDYGEGGGEARYQRCFRRCAATSADRERCARSCREAVFRSIASRAAVTPADRDREYRAVRARIANHAGIG